MAVGLRRWGIAVYFCHRGRVQEDESSSRLRKEGPAWDLRRYFATLDLPGFSCVSPPKFELKTFADP